MNHGIVIRENHAFNILTGQCYLLGLPEGVQVNECSTHILHNGDLYLESAWRGRIEARKVQIMERVDQYSRGLFLSSFRPLRQLPAPGSRQLVLQEIVQHNHLFCSPPSDCYYLPRPVSTHFPGFAKVSSDSVGNIMGLDGFLFWEESGRLFTNVPIQPRYGIVHRVFSDATQMRVADATQMRVADATHAHHFGENYLAIRMKATRMTSEYSVLIVLTTTYSSTSPSFPSSFARKSLADLKANLSPSDNTPPPGAVYLKIYFLPKVDNLSKIQYDARSSTIFYVEDAEKPLVFDRPTMSFVSLSNFIKRQVRIRKLTERKNTYYAFFDGNVVCDTRGLVFRTNRPDYVYQNMQCTRTDLIFFSGPPVDVRVQHPHRVIFIDPSPQLEDKKDIYLYSGTVKILRCRLDPRWFTIEPELSPRYFGYHTREDISFMGKSIEPIRYINGTSQDPLEFFAKVVRDYRAKTADLFFLPRLWLAETEEESFQVYTETLKAFQSRFLVPHGKGSSFAKDPIDSLAVVDACGELFRLFLDHHGSPLPFRMPVEFFSIFMERKYRTRITPEMLEYFEEQWSVPVTGEDNRLTEYLPWVRDLCCTILDELQPVQRHPVDLDYYLSGSY